MNLKQINFYEILDALQVNAQAGFDAFEITTGIKINNECVKVNIKPKAHGIVETKKSTYVIISVGDLGMILKATKGKLVSVQLLDLTHETPHDYLNSGVAPDCRALLTHIKYEGDRGVQVAWILETIIC